MLCLTNTFPDTFRGGHQYFITALLAYIQIVFTALLLTIEDTHPCIKYYALDIFKTSFHFLHPIITSLEIFAKNLRKSLFTYIKQLNSNAAGQSLRSFCYHCMLATTIYACNSTLTRYTVKLCVLH